MTIPIQAKELKPPTNCGERVELCEEALEIATSLIRAQHDQLKSQLDILIEADKENQSLLVLNEKMIEQQTKWYRNPLIMTILGFSLGVVTIELAK